jgi:ABC-2 type transport system ATP-binding protein
MTEQAVLTLSNLVMSYESGSKVLNDLDFSLTPGSVTGLLGKNGAGKTTLMRIALGLLKPHRGKAELFGKPAWDAAQDIRKRIGYVPQSEAPFNWMRVSDCLTLVGSFHDDWDKTLIKRYLHEWDLDPGSFIPDLSSGQRQKVSILTAIGHRPELLVLDEPVASLDPGARRQFLKALVELNQDLDRTILFSTHITSDIERVVADVAVLHEGKLRYRGELDELKEKCQRLYFSGSALPDKLEENDVQNYKRNGDRASALARDWSSERTRALSKTLGAKVTAATLPLEELFLELTHD